VQECPRDQTANPISGIGADSFSEAEVDTVTYPEPYYDVLADINALTIDFPTDIEGRRKAVTAVLNKGSRFVIHDETDVEVELHAENPSILLGKLRAHRDRYEAQMESERVENLSAAGRTDTDEDA